MKLESLVKLYLHEPPTPTNRALPRFELMILQILSMCLRASSNMTSPIFFDGKASLYLAILSFAIFLTASTDGQASYTNGISLTSSSYASYSSLLWKSQNSKSVSTYSLVTSKASFNFSTVTLSRKSQKTFLSGLLSSLSSNTRSHSCLHKATRNTSDFILPGEFDAFWITLNFKFWATPQMPWNTLDSSLMLNI